MRSQVASASSSLCCGFLLGRFLELKTLQAVSAIVHREGRTCRDFQLLIEDAFMLAGIEPLLYIFSVSYVAGPVSAAVLIPGRQTLFSQVLASQSRTSH